MVKRLLHTLARQLVSLWYWPRRAKFRRNAHRPTIETVSGRSFVVLPQVFNPVAFRSGQYFADFVQTAPELASGTASVRALDLGTGTGIQAVFAASRGFEVTAIDINPHAVRCARMNVLLNELDRHITVLQGDLFEPVPNERFNVVIFNPPFFHGVPKNDFDRAWRSPDVVSRFTRSLADALTPDGIAIVAWSSHADDSELVSSALRAGFSVSTAREYELFGETLRILRFRREAS